MVTATAVIQRAKDPGRFLFLSPILRFHGFSYSNPGNTERKPASPGVVVRMLSPLSHSAVHMYVCTCTYPILRVISRTVLVLHTFSMTAVAVNHTVITQPYRGPTTPGAVDLNIEREELLPPADRGSVVTALRHGGIKEADRRTLREGGLSRVSPG